MLCYLTDEIEANEEVNDKREKLLAFIACYPCEVTLAKTYWFIADANSTLPTGESTYFIESFEKNEPAQKVLPLLFFVLHLLIYSFVYASIS